MWLKRAICAKLFPLNKVKILWRRLIVAATLLYLYANVAARGFNPNSASEMELLNCAFSFMFYGHCVISNFTLFDFMYNRMRV